MWPIEEIPNADSVFMRAHRTYFKSGELAPGVFQAHDGGMSVNWDKYASADDTKQQAARPDDNAVISFLVAAIRAIKDLDVTHTPEDNNRAHSDVNLPDRREELTEIRVLLGRIVEIAIPFP
jgi:hypothetical protein